jgi:hypothetical protein
MAGLGTAEWLGSSGEALLSGGVAWHEEGSVRAVLQRAGSGGLRVEGDEDDEGNSRTGEPLVGGTSQMLFSNCVDLHGLNSEQSKV